MDGAISQRPHLHLSGASAVSFQAGVIKATPTEDISLPAKWPDSSETVSRNR